MNNLTKQFKDKFYVELDFNGMYTPECVYAHTAMEAVNTVISNLNERLIEDDCNPMAIEDATKIVVIKLPK